eukprot:14918832-Alexandrium_andersonii.AAC.1
MHASRQASRPVRTAGRSVSKSARRRSGRISVAISCAMGSPEPGNALIDGRPVSYTHLTLPTICSV